MALPHVVMIGDSHVALLAFEMCHNNQFKADVHGWSPISFDIFDL